MTTAFANEPILELRRSAVRGELAEALAGIDRELPLSVPVLVGRRRAHRRRARLDRPGQPVAGRGQRGAGHRRRRRRRRGAGAARARAPGAPPRPPIAPPRSSRPPRGCASAACGSPRCRSASAPSRGPRPTPTCARPSTSSSTTRGWPSSSSKGRPLLQVPGERNELRYVPRGHRRRHLPLELPAGHPLRHDLRGAGRRQRRRPQAGRAVARRCRTSSSRPCAPGASRPRRSPSCPARATPERRSWPTPTSTPSPSPARWRWGARSSPARPRLRDGQNHFKQVVAELGGKNCVIVASDADLDEAVPAIVGSAFNYAGQKCSAASRVLVHEAIADQLLERLAGAVRTLVVGQAETLGTDVPPVIEREAQERVARYEQAAQSGGRIVAQAERARGRRLVLPCDAGRRSPRRLARARGGDLRAAARGPARARRRPRLRRRRRPLLCPHRRPVHP